MKELICIICPRGCLLKVDDSFNVTGNFCPRGVSYAKDELTNPVRTLTTTVICTGFMSPRLPVKSDKPLPKSLILKAMRELDNISVNPPVHIGDVILENILNTGVNIVATKNIIK